MMTVVNVESATSYIHQPKISFFVTGDWEVWVMAIFLFWRLGDVDGVGKCREADFGAGKIRLIEMAR